MPKPQLTALCARLCRLAQLLSVEAETAKDADDFYYSLNRVLDFAPEQEALAFRTCDSILESMGDRETLRWLSEELEYEGMLQLRPDARGRPQACIVFAVPVVLPAEDSLEPHATAHGLEALHDVLRDAQLLDDRANFGLVNRAFSATDFLSKTPGEMKRLNIELADQVMQGERTLRLPENFDAEIAHGASASPEVRLHFILGMAVISDELLEDLFPRLPDMPEEMERSGSTMRLLAQSEPDERGYIFQEGSIGTMVMNERGMTEQGLTWEQAFQTAFDDAFDTLEGALTALAPQGLYEDLRCGQECAREVALMLSVRNGMPVDAEPPLTARITPTVDMRQGDSVTVEIRCAGQQPERPIRVAWPVLGHESMDDAMGQLALCLDDNSIKIESPFKTAQTAMPVSMRLH
jgi:hypothetical protein